MADPVTDLVAEHDARYEEEGAVPPEWARVHDRLVHDGAAGMAARARHEVRRKGWA
ncbi:hypothetical protein ABT150_47090 [Streptomyces mirabilis]|uniref:hypothetical protein n=1 Tax=Streptomyces mirabilis TaxID=68239 RepID=UPI0033274F8C